ncbi:MAG: glycosyltransferase family 2 protein [Bacteroidaceae bacterium]|nr:glycosyltransferase family 2 protein [Bacteroidaceae bacterium]
MSWYKAFEKYYERSWKEVPAAEIDMLRQQVSALNEVSQPLASVVFIAHNEEKRLFSSLSSIVMNDKDVSFEVIVVNNNSTDSTEEFLQTVGVNYYNETKKGPGHARNCGLDKARGKYYICIDSDTLYPPHYVSTMVKALQREGTACAYGLWSFLPDANHSAFGLWFYEKLRDMYLRFQQIKRPELNVRGMVFAFPTELGRKYRFRTDIIRGEDGSLALNMKADGKLCFVTSRKARAVTGHGTIDQDGGLLQTFMRRLKKAFANVLGLFTSKKKYEDKDSNMIKP